MSPDQVAERVALGPGVEVLIRPIRPTDKHLLADGFAALSPESKFQRFFAPVVRLSESDLVYLTEIDHHHHEALVAIDPDEGDLIGVTRYIRTSPYRDREAEVAIVISDQWRGKGLGKALLSRLATRAREEGVTHFLAVILAENEGSIDLFENFAPKKTHVAAGDPGQVEVRIDLPWSGEFSDSVLGYALRSAARGSHRFRTWRRMRRRMRRRPGREKPAGKVREFGKTD
ncbi:MAG TPA: GNAT family N-acetyltransferase [Solirubrobacterales bacterium]|nr:GNAT family N-acetyltransferase [Solirubrobacterales bacterium]HMX71327.1 GNAT family N-acetyltransferase [Solirubrobacterales bacterium]HMY25895.1 GNAT family N-acetyltransferase [Solirubrobacterales bacterium]HNA24715.1 GNAT family N-acetyltransferase [Solirubrobacterales bacterium]HNA44904.1 GNAT family N-acetyltransferase [Solirubrobacterales bacterium]